MHAVHLKGRTLKPIKPSPSGRGLGEGRILAATSTLTRRAFAPLMARLPLPWRRGGWRCTNYFEQLRSVTADNLKA